LLLLWLLLLLLLLLRLHLHLRLLQLCALRARGVRSVCARYALVSRCGTL